MTTHLQRYWINQPSDSEMKIDDMIPLVQQWADARGIYQHGTDTAQLLKAVSEMGELADAHAKDDRTGKYDAVGDVLVCLINYCHMNGMTLAACLDHAWQQIRDRKGRMAPGGVFVKDELEAIK